MKNGYVQVYTGDGKGKTTAALGLTLRAAGHGLRSYIGQFMKGQPYGELEALRNQPLITIEQYGDTRCMRREDVSAEDVARARQGLERAADAMTSGRNEIVVLDEINLAVAWKLIELDVVLRLIEDRPSNVDLVLTGRDADKEIVKIADLVTEMLNIKHPYEEGIAARRGIEY